MTSQVLEPAEAPIMLRGEKFFKSPITIYIIGLGRLSDTQNFGFHHQVLGIDKSGNE